MECEFLNMSDAHIMAPSDHTQPPETSMPIALLITTLAGLAGYDRTVRK